VTVCVAAICEGTRLIGASDRMLTAGDIQFERQQTKVWQLTPHLAVMIAGDASIHTEILRCVELDVLAQVEEPHRMVPVREAARLYRHHLREALIARAEDALLKPVGLDRQTFVSRQQELNADVLARLTNDLLNYRFTDPLEAIILGIDMDGPQGAVPGLRYPHLYVAYDSDVKCEDATGFAAIGIGRSHAQSQFMFAGYERRWKFPKALLLAHSAKKRAEVSPGVGKATDMFSIGPGDSPFFAIAEHVIEELGKNYEEMQENIRRASAQADQRMKMFDEEIAKKVERANNPTAQAISSKDQLTPGETKHDP